jgi:hypothetical protein
MQIRYVTTVSIAFCLLMLCSTAGTIYLYPTSPVIPSNGTVQFMTSTNSCIPLSALAWQDCQNLNQSLKGNRGWVTVPNETSYQIEPYSQGNYNYSGLSIYANDSIKFSKPGIWDIFVIFYNSSSPFETYSTNSIVTVEPPLKVKIALASSAVLPGQSELLYADATGGVKPYSYQWFNNSACTSLIINATGSSQTTNALNVSSGYCVRVNDSLGMQDIAYASANITVQHIIYGSSGAQISPSYGKGELIPPEVVSVQNGYTIYNVTPYSSFNIEFCGGLFNVTSGDFSPNSSTISASAHQYNLLLDKPISFNGNGQGCFVRLSNVSWAPILHVITLEFFYGASSTSTSLSSTSTTVNTTSSVPASSSVSSVYSTTILPTTTMPFKDTGLSARQANEVAHPVKAVTDFTGKLMFFSVIVIAFIVLIVSFTYKKKRRPPRDVTAASKSDMVDL